MFIKFTSEQSCLYVRLSSCLKRVSSITVTFRAGMDGPPCGDTEWSASGPRKAL